MITLFHNSELITGVQALNSPRRAARRCPQRRWRSRSRSDWKEYELLPPRSPRRASLLSVPGALSMVPAATRLDPARAMPPPPRPVARTLLPPVPPLATLRRRRVGRSCPQHRWLLLGGSPAVSGVCCATHIAYYGGSTGAARACTPAYMVSPLLVHSSLAPIDTCAGALGGLCG